MFNSSEYWGAYYSVEICDDYFKSKINQGLDLSLNWHSEIKLAIKDNFAFSQQIIRCVLSLITRDIGVSWHRGSYNEFPRRNFPEQTTWDNFGTSHIMLQLQKCLFYTFWHGHLTVLTHPDMPYTILCFSIKREFGRNTRLGDNMESRHWYRPTNTSGCLFHLSMVTIL